MSDTFPSSQDMLVKMVTDTRQMVEQRKQAIPLAGIYALATMQRRPLDLSSRLLAEPSVALIAQIKRKDPDVGSLVENYDPLTLATRFETAGACALTVATNEKYYQGGIADVTLISQSVNIPVIRQDFVYDEYQIVEARAAGADAVLLIATLLDPPRLRNLISITQRNRMTAVVQVQSEDETLQAVEYEARVIAISNRDMHTFTVDLETTHRLRHLIPPRMATISVGGLKTAEDIAYVQRAHIHAVMVGQALLTASNTTQAIEDLFKLTKHETLSNH